MKMSVASEQKKSFPPILRNYRKSSRKVSLKLSAGEVQCLSSYVGNKSNRFIDRKYLSDITVVFEKHRKQRREKQEVLWYNVA